MNLRLGRGLTAIVETPRLGAHPLGQLRVPPHVTFFFLRTFVAFFADVVAALSIKKSSSLPPSLIAATIHRGFAPRPAHNSPLGPRYFGATFFPFMALPLCQRATVLQLPAQPKNADAAPHPALPEARFVPDRQRNPQAG